MGGPRGAARGAIAGRASTANLTNFFSALSQSGLDAAARIFGIDKFLNQSADVFLLQLADALSPAGALVEDAIAREAMNATLEELYGKFDIQTNGIDALERMTGAAMAETVLKYVSNYIYERVIQALTDHIHHTATLPSRIAEIERGARAYINDAVAADIDISAFFGADGTALAQWNAGQSLQVSDRLFVECYSVVESGLKQSKRRR